jgi:uncharacterized protein (TIGR02001 family)
VWRLAVSACAATALVMCMAAPAAAQAPAPAAPPDPNAGAMTVSVTMDLLNQYMFRGIRQNSTEVAMWPTVDLGLATFSGDGALKSVGLNFGVWNSLHTGDTGSDGPTGKLWYESDFYATVGFGFGGGVSLATTYTAYTSPNNMFSTVKELAFKLALDDSPHLGKAAMKPYLVIGQEFDADPGVGQADAGLSAGTYMELGVAPAVSGSKASLSVPLRVGMSLNDYYELDGDDHAFGFFSVAGIVTVPLGGTTNFGAWNVHGGVEFQALGDTTKFFNGGDGSQVIGSVGVGFTY